jgi:hypothetical protein
MFHAMFHAQGFELFLFYQDPDRADWSNSNRGELRVHAQHAGLKDI